MAAAPEEAFNENDSGSYGQPKLEALNRIAVCAAYWALDAGEYDAARNLIARHRDDDLRFNNESFGSLAGQLAFHEDDFDKALGFKPNQPIDKHEQIMIPTV
ncbi:hypothetical protein NHF45_12910 [Maricaulaceae bacterium NA33B04]|nr:hypothetical protein [Maricaulaceae bacterium NA33B04]